MNKCLNCSKEPIPNRSTYCSSRCGSRHRDRIYINRWQNKLETGYTSPGRLKNCVRRYILAKYNYACARCGWNERHPVDNLPCVQIDHKDGNILNCYEENLEVLCPNCHSLTDTFMARNSNKNKETRKKYKRKFISSMPSPRDLASTLRTSNDQFDSD